MLSESFQQEADKAVVSGADGTDDARYAPAVIVPGCFIPVLHMPVVAAGTAAPGGTPLERVNSTPAAHTRRQTRAVRPDAAAPALRAARLPICG